MDRNERSSDRAGELPRRRIGAFELLDRVGRGPRGDVWRARTPGGTLVALKILHGHITDRPNFLTAFEKETAALTAVSHPNILGAIDRGRAGHQYYLVTQLMRRGSLEEAQRSSRMSIQDAAEVGLAVCEALDYGHRRALLHRNLVPSNVLIDDSGRLRVSDFGLSLLGGDDKATSYDARSDLYGLAALLYELVSGSRVGLDDTPLAARIPNLPQRIDAFFARALSRDLIERFSRASEMALALRLATRGGASETEDPDAITLAIHADTINVTIAAHATATNAKSCLEELNRVLARRGPWKLGYDLSALALLDDNLVSLLTAVHMRHQRNLERVAFCSARGLVRSNALMVACAVKRVPWKIFATPAPMQKWMHQPEAVR